MKSIAKLPVTAYGDLPEKVLQFGDGNFLRAFVDWMIDRANASGRFHGSVVICQTIPTGLADLINSQDGRYTVIMRGCEDGSPAEKYEQVTSVSRCINPYCDYEALMEVARSPELSVVVSNTTEAGISYQENDVRTSRPPVAYPAKLCAVLYERYQALGHVPGKGLLILPVELIDDNGTKLKELVLRYAREWKLECGFMRWLEEENLFANTLVDRIVTGYPKAEEDRLTEKLGYRDRLMVACELFNLWVIEGKQEWAARFPVGDGMANVVWTDCVTPYKKRKVRILNGSHTAVVPVAYLAGYDTVSEFLQDSLLSRLEHDLIFQEIIPSVSMDPEELVPFAEEVERRFRNPFITHYLADIQLNSCSKFTARCLPTILEYREKTGELPRRMVFGLAALIRYFKVKEVNGAYVGRRDNKTTYQVRDEKSVLRSFANVWLSGNPGNAAAHALSESSLWGGRNLIEIPGLYHMVTGYLEQMERDGVLQTIKCLGEMGETE